MTPATDATQIQPLAEVWQGMGAEATQSPHDWSPPVFGSTITSLLNDHLLKKLDDALSAVCSKLGISNEQVDLIYRLAREDEDITIDRNFEDDHAEGIFLKMIQVPRLIMQQVPLLSTDGRAQRVVLLKEVLRKKGAKRGPELFFEVALNIKNCTFENMTHTLSPVARATALAERLLQKPEPPEIAELKEILGGFSGTTIDEKKEYVRAMNEVLNRIGCRIRLPDGRLARLCVKPGKTGVGFIQFCPSEGGSCGGFGHTEIEIVPFRRAQQ